jgi:long-chain acyl-CoA synthetase
MDTQKTIPQIIESQIKKYGGKTLIQHKDGWSWKQITWLDFEKKIKDAVSFLMDLGFAPGDAALMVSGNRIESLYAEFAIYLLGGILVPMPEDETQDVIVQVVADSKSRFIFVGNEPALDKIQSIADEIPSLEKIITFPDANIGENEKIIAFKALLKFGSIKRKGLTDELIRAANGVLPTSVAAIFYNLNSDGRIEKKEIIHYDLIQSIHAASERLSFITEEDQSFSYLPSFGLFERFANYLGIYKGIRIALSETREEFLEDILEVKPTVLFETKSGLEDICSKIVSNLGRNSPTLKPKSALGGRIKYIITDSPPGGEIKNLFSKEGVSLIEVPELIRL